MRVIRIPCAYDDSDHIDVETQERSEGHRIALVMSAQDDIVLLDYDGTLALIAALHERLGFLMRDAS